MTKQPDLSTFPDKIYRDTRCGGPQSTFPRHATYGESRPQRGLLYIAAKANRYQAPKQTCCMNQANTLIRILDPDQRLT